MADTGSLTRWFVSLGLILVLGIGVMVNGFGHGHPTWGETIGTTIESVQAEVARYLPVTVTHRVTPTLTPARSQQG